MMQKLFLLSAIVLLPLASLCAQLRSEVSDEETIWRGYYANGMSVNAIGTGWSVTYDVAAFIPGGTYFANGATLNGLRHADGRTEKILVK